MGLSSSKSTVGPSKFAKPYISGAADTINSAYNANAGNIQQATDSVTNLLPDMIAKYKAGDAGINAARNYNVDVLGGKFLEGNPFLQQMIDQSGNDVRNQMQASLGTRGLTGGSSYFDIISKNLAKNATGLRYQDYDSERARMATAAGQSPSIAAGDVIQVAPMLSTLQASMTPIDAAQGYAGSIGGLLGNYTTQKQRPGFGQMLLGGLSNAAQAMAMGG